MAEYLTPPPAQGVGQFTPATHEIRILPAGEVVWRVYHRRPYGTAWNTFRRYGPTTSRFDHHPAPASSSSGRSILYGAAAYPTCLAEAFQDTRTVNRFADDPHLAAFVFDRDLVLLDVAGSWITRAGASMAINSGSRAVARQWSGAIYDAFVEIDGIHYASSMDGNASAYAFYDRAEQHIQPSSPPFDARLSAARLAPGLSRAAQRLGYRMI